MDQKQFDTFSKFLKNFADRCGYDLTPKHLDEYNDGLKQYPANQCLEALVRWQADRPHIFPTVKDIVTHLPYRRRFYSKFSNDIPGDANHVPIY